MLAVTRARPNPGPRPNATVSAHLNLTQLPFSESVLSLGVQQSRRAGPGARTVPVCQAPGGCAPCRSPVSCPPPPPPSPCRRSVPRPVSESRARVSVVHENGSRGAKQGSASSCRAGPSLPRRVAPRHWEGRPDSNFLRTSGPQRPRRPQPRTTSRSEGGGPRPCQRGGN